MPLIEAIKSEFPEQQILLSTMTATGRAVAGETIAQVDALVYFPLDLPGIVANALRQFNPTLVILLETEVWPNFIHTSSRRGVPVMMLSGRLSERSARRYRRFAGVFVRVLREISAFGMQDCEHAGRLVELGVDPVRIAVTGSLKQVDVGPTKGPAELDTITGHQGRPVVVIGSTHKGEEAVFLESVARLRIEFPHVLLVIAPRHPERFDEVETLLRREQVHYRKRSEPGPLDLHACEVFLMDSVGELPWIYEWANVVFVGGTLVEVGGHNLIEPARLGKPVLLGPYTANVAAVARTMIEGGGAVQVQTKDELVQQLSRLLANPEYAEEMGSRARALAPLNRRVLSDTMELVRKFVGSGVPETQV